MNNEYKVKIVYRNKEQNPVDTKYYSLKDYTDMFRVDLLRLIADVEDMVYVMNGNKPKEEWSDETWSAFCRIKHKLLDKAGEIQRLPSNLSGSEASDESCSTLGSFVADVLNNKAHG